MAHAAVAEVPCCSCCRLNAPAAEPAATPSSSLSSCRPGGEWGSAHACLAACGTGLCCTLYPGLTPPPVPAGGRSRRPLPQQPTCASACAPPRGWSSKAAAAAGTAASPPSASCPSCCRAAAPLPSSSSARNAAPTSSSGHPAAAMAAARSGRALAESALQRCSARSATSCSATAESSADRLRSRSSRWVQQVSARMWRGREQEQETRNTSRRQRTHIFEPPLEGLARQQMCAASSHHAGQGRRRWPHTSHPARATVRGSPQQVPEGCRHLARTWQPVRVQCSSIFIVAVSHCV